MVCVCACVRACVRACVCVQACYIYTHTFIYPVHEEVLQCNVVDCGCFIRNVFPIYALTLIISMSVGHYGVDRKFLCVLLDPTYTCCIHRRVSACSIGTVWLNAAQCAYIVPWLH